MSSAPAPRGAEPPPDRAVFTIASGKQSYLDMAVTLARSFEWHNRSNALPFYILTDHVWPLPADLRRTQLIVIDPADLGVGFTAKLNIYRYAPAAASIFLDADCLCLRDMGPVFDTLSQKPVAVLGISITDGEWFGDVAKRCRDLGVPSVPKFNGGVYGIIRSNTAERVFDRARAMEAQYDKMGFVRLRGQPNEEVLIAISLALEGVYPIPNLGDLYADFQWWPDLIQLDVLKGVCSMRNPPPGAERHQSSFPADQARPAILHFLGSYVASPEYRRASWALRLRETPFASLIALLLTGPQYLERRLKDILRAPYRLFFGARKVRADHTRLIVAPEIL